MKSQLPLRSAIIEILRDNKGVVIDTDLIIALKSRYGDYNFSNTEINRNLLALETQGLIHVQNITNRRRRIQQIESENVYMGVEED
ncbi:MAG: hypothetical protein OEZ01_09870 [Candidatus Heimdallarchaeota archaeon]|nr:hypothetical protein [Candidatus Heimdallarchaeota archaeon]MDH5646304.1 hypothetical protein [Candidatus Heimdallarchaeota archaeon]